MYVNVIVAIDGLSVDSYAVALAKAQRGACCPVARGLP